MMSQQPQQGEGAARAAAACLGRERIAKNSGKILDFSSEIKIFSGENGDFRGKRLICSRENVFFSGKMCVLSRGNVDFSAQNGDFSGEDGDCRHERDEQLGRKYGKCP